MTCEVITATPETPLREIAALLERNGVKRVPIVKKRKIVGIVSRANLVQALVAQGEETEERPAIDDLTIREEVMARLDGQPWTRLSPVNVIVHDGTVDLWGIVDSETVKQAVRVAVEMTPGVGTINDHLVVQRTTAYI